MDTGRVVDVSALGSSLGSLSSARGGAGAVPARHDDDPEAATVRGRYLVADPPLESARPAASIAPVMAKAPRTGNSAERGRGCARVHGIQPAHLCALGSCAHPGRDPACHSVRLVLHVTVLKDHCSRPLRRARLPPPSCREGPARRSWPSSLSARGAPVDADRAPATDRPTAQATGRGDAASARPGSASTRPWIRSMLIAGVWCR